LVTLKELTVSMSGRPGWRCQRDQMVQGLAINARNNPFSFSMPFSLGFSAALPGPESHRRHLPGMGGARAMDTAQITKNVAEGVHAAFEP
jgi:hypothetical protein